MDEDGDGMFDIWIGDVELTRCALIFSLVVLLPLQLLLCFKVKQKGIRLIPVTLFLYWRQFWR